jgi:hypothetical protein
MGVGLDGVGPVVLPDVGGAHPMKQRTHNLIGPTFGGCGRCASTTRGKSRPAGLLTSRAQLLFCRAAPTEA